MAESTSGFNRRRFIGGVAGAAAAGSVLSGGLPAGMAEAMAEPRRKGSLDDVEHVVVLMQENRSFDHYYGTMRGVRGFGDRAPVRLGDGTVFHQPDAARTDGGFLEPFHVDTSKVDGQDIRDLDHSWIPTHDMWDNGRWDAWVPNKSELAMGYFTSADIPFQRALADAFTTCDHYFCSIQGPTTPNRLYHWSGTINPAGDLGGPAITNPDDYNPVFNWTTYPERLQAAGVSWQLYANKEVGDGGGLLDGWVGDFGDNPLWLFQAYHDAMVSTDPAVRQLADRANVILPWQPNSGLGMNASHVLADFIAAAKAGTLPRVSWIVAPFAWCEHPTARPVDGAVYVQTVLKALWDNPKMWDSTALFINYDENDGFFDHVVPPTAPDGTPDEFVDGLPIGLGPRVPMTVISPWSRGGWVNSQVFDHTSVIRFLERWTGVREPNISAWRRSITGDLTSCFDFAKRDLSIPRLPDANKLQAIADQTQSKLPTPTPPADGAQVAPRQEPGFRPARALPYQPTANAAVNTATGDVTLALANSGAVAIQLGVYPNGATPSRFDIAPAGRASTTVPAAGDGTYDIAVYAANGFLREFAGRRGGSHVEVTVTVVEEHHRPGLRIAVHNGGGSTATVRVTGTRPGGGRPATFHIPAGTTVSTDRDVVGDGHGWYDVLATVEGDATFRRRFAGHVENGEDTVTG